MNIQEPALRQVHLKPGELLLTQESCLVVTVLGSCLAVTMFNARLGLAAICHAMLPRPKQATPANRDVHERFKYLSEVIPWMTQKFLDSGAGPAEIEVKLFGGGNVIGGDRNAAVEKWLGNVNVQTARDLLQSVRLPVKAANVGGQRGRKIIFHTGTGAVLHKHLERSLHNA